MSSLFTARSLNCSQAAKVHDLKAMTLVEVMVSMTVITVFMLSLLSTSLQSRRISEQEVITSAATSAIYGMIEQMKQLDYTNLMPITTTDPDQPLYDDYPPSVTKTPPYIRIRLDQDNITWLLCSYNSGTAPDAAPSNLTGLPAAMKNTIGPIPLSTVSNASSQSLTLQIWIWVDQFTDTTRDISDAKTVTIVYAYSFNEGRSIRTIIKRECFLRAPFKTLS